MDLPGAVGSVLDGSPNATVRPLSPGEEEGRPPPSSSAPLTAPSRQEIRSSDGRKRSSGGGRWRSAAGMARGGAGSQTYRTAADEHGSRRTRSSGVCVCVCESGSRRPHPSHGVLKRLVGTNPVEKKDELVLRLGVCGPRSSTLERCVTPSAAGMT